MEYVAAILVVLLLVRWTILRTPFRNCGNADELLPFRNIVGIRELTRRVHALETNAPTDTRGTSCNAST